jgi:hypothetical protein
MKQIVIRSLMLFLLVFLCRCYTSEEDPWISSAFFCGILSTEVESYTADEVFVKFRFFILDAEEGDKLTRRDVFSQMTIYLTGYNGYMLNYQKTNTDPSGNYSCAVLVDDVYNQINYDYWDPISRTEYFVREFFKTAGEGNRFLFSMMRDKTNPLTIYGDGFTEQAETYDQVLAHQLNNVPDNIGMDFDSVPLPYCLNELIDYTDLHAGTANKSILSLYSSNTFPRMGYSMQALIDKAKNKGIRVFTILDAGGSVNNWEYDGRELLFKIASETGGAVFENSDFDAKDLIILGSQMGPIMEGNFPCFEVRWRLVRESWADTFQPGFFEQGELQTVIQTGYDKKEFTMPFGLWIK